MGYMFFGGRVPASALHITILREDVQDKQGIHLCFSADHECKKTANGIVALECWRVAQRAEYGQNVPYHVCFHQPSYNAEA